MVNGFNKELKDLLEHKFNLYNSTNFIIEDPISIPHAYNQKEDIEICESVQKGLASGAYTPGRYAEVEKGEYHFHQLLFQKYSAISSQRL